MPSRIIAVKYAKLFADAEAIKKSLVGKAGTMQADINAFRAVLQAKLADAQFMSTLVNEYMKGAEVKLAK